MKIHNIQFNAFHVLFLPCSLPFSGALIHFTHLTLNDCPVLFHSKDSNAPVHLNEAKLDLSLSAKVALLSCTKSRTTGLPWLALQQTNVQRAAGPLHTRYYQEQAEKTRYRVKTRIYVLASYDT